MATTVPDFPHERRRNVTDRRTGPMPRVAGGAIPVHDPVARERAAQATRLASMRVPATMDGMRVSWGGVWGGVLAAVGLLLLLGALGVAVGITAVQPGSTDAATAGSAAAIWACASLLVALFVGGLVSTRAGAIHDRATGFWEGFLVWIVSLILLAWLATSGMTSIATGAMQVMGVASQAATPVDPAAAVEALRERVQSAAGDAQALTQRAVEAQPVASKVAWIAFGALLLSLVAAIGGALAGRRRFPGFTR